MEFELCEQSLEGVPWQQIRLLLDSCFPRPPRDVFERVLAGSHRRQRLWLASSNTSELLGLVMLTPHSKGGHLDNLAVSPDARGHGVGQALVLCLLADTFKNCSPMVSLTTRIPSYFEPFGFKPCGLLTDGSTAMVCLSPNFL